MRKRKLKHLGLTMRKESNTHKTHQWQEKQRKMVSNLLDNFEQIDDGTSIQREVTKYC